MYVPRSRETWVALVFACVIVGLTTPVYAQTAVRTLPSGGYTPGVPVSVSIEVNPPAVEMWTAAETPPAGWTVSNISDSGAWDSIGERVVWEFYSPDTTTLTYDATPPPIESGTKTFTGTVYFVLHSTDPVPITGDTTIDRGATCTTLVPDVVGSSESAARASIEAADLVVGTVTQVSSATVPAGNVASLYPTALTPVACGSAVNVGVSAGPVPVLTLTTPSHTPGPEDLSWGTIGVENTGVGEMHWTASVVSGESWIWLSPFVDSFAVNLHKNTSRGRREGSIRVTAPGALGSPKHVTVLQLGLYSESVKYIGGRISEQFPIADGAGGGNTAQEPYVVAEGAVANMPAWLATPVSSAYRVGPSGVFPEPVTVQLPVPEGEGAEILDVFYFSESAIHRGWYDGGKVTGWMVPGSRRIVEEDGLQYVEIQVNHSGIVQLGRVPRVAVAGLGPVPVAIDGSPRQWVYLVLTLLALGIGLAACWSWPRRTGRASPE